MVLFCSLSFPKFSEYFYNEHVLLYKEKKAISVNVTATFWGIFLPNKLVNHTLVISKNP